MREFKDFDAAEEARRTPKGLLIGITGPQFSGKSYSAGRLATGAQRVTGGKIYWVDTENDRALEVEPYFQFRHVRFSQPKEPREYEEVVRYCLSKPDCGVIILDQCTHEHVALLDMRDAYLDKKAGDDWQKRERLTAAALVLPKAQRKRFEELVAYGAIRADGQKVPMILLYRATDKSKPGKSKREGGEGGWVHQGWQAETTSGLPYQMTARFLLPPGSDGHPNLAPDTEWEKLQIRNPQQFRDWFQPGFQLTEDIGERLARWAKGETTTAATERPAVSSAATSPAPDAAERDAIFARMNACLTLHHGDDKAKRLDALQSAFGTGARQAIAKMGTDQLRIGVEELEKQLTALAAMKRTERDPGTGADDEAL